MSKYGSVLEYVLFISKHLRGARPQTIAKLILVELNIPPKGTATGYLIKGVILFMQDFAQSLTKELYPGIGKSSKPKADGRAVEISMRTAVNKGWRERSERSWNLFFPGEPGGQAKKPTLGVFISRISIIVDLWQECRDAMEPEGERNFTVL